VHKWDLLYEFQRRGKKKISDVCRMKIKKLYRTFENINGNILFK